MTTTFAHNEAFTVISCGHEGCGVVFAIPNDYYDARRRDHKTFYCPNGHMRYYPGESQEQKIQKLTSQLDIERTRAESWKQTVHQREKQLDYSRRATKANATRLRKVKDRVKNGVCPCCNRTFVNLQRHMHTKHPSYGDSHES